MEDLANEKYWNNIINQSILRFCILKVFEKEELHAYILPSKINEFTHGYSPNPSPGTLYTTLANMEKNGYLKSRQLKVGKRLRKLYKLTPKGKDALEEATKAWSKITFMLAKICIYRQW